MLNHVLIIVDSFAFRYTSAQQTANKTTIKNFTKNTIYTIIIFAYYNQHYKNTHTKENIMQHPTRGFTLTSLIVAIVILGILATVALPMYRDSVKNARLREAHAALLKNAHALEAFYRQHGKFKKNSTTWADIPIGETDHFCLRPNGIARGALDSRFMLKAVAFDPNNEPRVLKINESLNAFLCESSTSTCGDKKAHFSGSDKKCRPYQP